MAKGLTITKGVSPAMQWFKYRQNNSGGVFTYPAAMVFVQATSAVKADRLAKRAVGIYFDGVESGVDCDCCGDRWNCAYVGDGQDAPTFHGHGIADSDGNFCPTVASDLFAMAAEDGVPDIALVFADGHVTYRDRKKDVPR